MSLPEIPDEAMRAACRAVVAGFLDLNHPAAEGEIGWAEQDVRAAWPHLYVAALRDAAERIDVEHESPGGAYIDGDLLRSWADEVVR